MGRGRGQMRGQSSSRPSTKDTQCYRCGKYGHFSKECYTPDEKLYCKICKKKGSHNTAACNQKQKGKDKGGKDKGKSKGRYRDKSSSRSRSTSRDSQSSISSDTSQEDRKRGRKSRSRKRRSRRIEVTYEGGHTSRSGILCCSSGEVVTSNSIFFGKKKTLREKNTKAKQRMKQEHQRCISSANFFNTFNLINIKLFITVCLFITVYNFL